MHDCCWWWLIKNINSAMLSMWNMGRSLPNSLTYPAVITIEWVAERFVMNEKNIWVKNNQWCLAYPLGFRFPFNGKGLDVTFIKTQINEFYTQKLGCELL